MRYHEFLKLLAWICACEDVMMLLRHFQAGSDASQQQSQDGVLKRSNHPTALLFHVGFKAGAIVM
jgi:hypothetical protein